MANLKLAYKIIFPSKQPNKRGLHSTKMGQTISNYHYLLLRPLHTFSDLARQLLTSVITLMFSEFIELQKVEFAKRVQIT